MCEREGNKALSDSEKIRLQQESHLKRSEETRDSKEQKGVELEQSARRPLVCLSCTQMELLREEPQQWKGPIGLCDPVSERWIMWGPKGHAGVLFPLHHESITHTHTHTQTLRMCTHRCVHTGVKAHMHVQCQVKAHNIFRQIHTYTHASTLSHCKWAQTVFVSVSDEETEK